MNNQVEGLQESIAKLRTDIKEAKGKQAVHPIICLIPNSEFLNQSELVFKFGRKNTIPFDWSKNSLHLKFGNGETMW